MAEIWQWQGDATTGAGLVAFTGSQTVVISGTATVVVSGTATVNFSSSGTVNISGNGTASANDTAPTQGFYVGGRATTADQTYTDGKFAPIALNAKGEVKAQLTGRKIALPAISNNDAVLNVAAAGTSTVTITPPAGELWRVKLLTIDIATPSGSSSGTHTIFIRTGADATNGSVVAMSSNYGDAISMFYNTITSGTASSGKAPANASEQQRAILNLCASNACPLYIRYTNNTNATQTGTLTIRIVKEVEYIVS